MQPDEVRTSATGPGRLSRTQAYIPSRSGSSTTTASCAATSHRPRQEFLAALDKGMGFCDVVLGWDSNDQQYDNITFTGWHTAFPDAAVRLLPQTCRALPLEGNMLLFLGEFAGHAEAVCPRATLRRVLERAASLGYAASAAAEFEFFVFDETPASVREKNYQNLKNLTPGYFGYSMLRSAVHTELYQELLQLADDMRMPIESLHTETGPGVMEAALHYTEALEAADRAALFKTFVKVLAQRRGLMATAWPSGRSGCPGQAAICISSLARKDGSSAFYAQAGSHTMSERDALVRRRSAGADAASSSRWSPPPSTATRAWCRATGRRPVHTWGAAENRTCALRVIQGGPRASAWSIASPPRTLTPIWPLPWRSVQACGHRTPHRAR